MMTPRERLRATLNHQQPDRVCLDLGATWVTGIAASAYARLRAALNLPERPPKVHEPYQLLGFVEEDVRQALGVDVVGLWGRSTIFGFKNDGWKPWTLQDGTAVQVSKQFEYSEETNGDILVYPKGDRNAKPSGRLPKGGYFFDAIVRQQPIDEHNLDPNDWADSFGEFDDEDLAHFEREANHVHQQTDYGLVMNFGQGGLGDVAFVPGENLIEPKGLRDPNLWYEYLLLEPDYIRGIYELQTQAAIRNMELLHQAVGEKLDVIIISGTDFGGQEGMLISPKTFRSLWKPLFKQMNDWVHEHTTWKTFFHTDGSIVPILDDFIEIGVDIINPVQCSAAGMEAQAFKDTYGDRLVVWGGGVDTQNTLPFGSPEEVYDEVSERIRIFNSGGGFVFNNIHNIQAPTSSENLLAMYRAVKDSYATAEKF
ncbi:methylcobalamin:coenzyme M methyltransferase [Planctomycetes bacterium CA13]|uniref:Methylcobalamin:coenzyme M methyltransferase n=1 Tax=Novipirellula herctigrandis TaxID=2527986 RepID=A0A5C5Z585_9BACT|nr:methylcobalamin:coenzyme M methyltransferase [Planctomycetes bacterium CA13]